MERVSEVAHFMVGAKVAYFSGDILTLMEDIKIVRPTIFLSKQFSKTFLVLS